MKTNVKGKWALVTGANRGLGYRITKFMAAEGCNLVLHSRSLEHTKAVYEEVKAMGVEAYCVEAELLNPAEVTRMIKEINDHGTQIDILFNNAAIQIGYDDYYNTPVDYFTRSFMINTIAPTLLCYAFLPGMKERGFGRIINTTSGIHDEPAQAAYSASKAALDKLTTDLAGTVNGTDIIISLADPNWCRTDLGGPRATYDPDTVIPGIVLGAFANDKRSGRLIDVQTYSGLPLDEAISKFEAISKA